MPPGTPALLMTLAPNPQAAIAFPANPSGGRVTIAIPYFIARLKAGRQPDEAAKLIDFLLAAPAQRELPVLAWALPARTDIIPADPHYKMINKLLQKVAIYVPNWHQARKMLGG
jgi:ABC-type glycerol-3-phosphate transport system substrate-binding protein